MARADRIPPLLAGAGHPLHPRSPVHATYAAHMRDLEFTTPTLEKRDPQTITVDLAGEQMSLDRPKNWTLGKIADATSDVIPLEDRAAAILGFFGDIFAEDHYGKFLHRLFDHDDPINMPALTRFFTEIGRRWDEHDHWQRTYNRPLPDERNPTIIISAPPGSVVGDDVRLTLRGLGLDETGPIIATPPKDTVTLVIAGCVSRAQVVGQRWAVEQFLAATFPDGEAAYLVRRLNDQKDDLDLQHLDPMLSKLIEIWSPQNNDTPAAPANREERRAAERQQHAAGAHARP